MSTDRFEYHFDRWQEQLKTRREHGDQLDQVRIMEHFSYFKKADAAKQAAEVLAEIDYQCEIRKAGFLKHVLIARRHDEIDDEYFTSIKAVIAVVEEFGGEYDGCGGPIVEAGQ